MRGILLILLPTLVAGTLILLACQQANTVVHQFLLANGL